MTIMRMIAGLCVTLSVSACSTIENVTRNLPLGFDAGAATKQVFARNYDLDTLRFYAPADLKVSEGNGFYPFSDVVWRGDPIGDRPTQIAAMFQTAADRNNASLSGEIPVVVDIELRRFHGVTERTRFSYGGVYHIVFDMTVRHAETGLIIEPTRRVNESLSAPGGVAALMADQRGETEKVRVTDFLTLVLQKELTGVTEL